MSEAEKLKDTAAACQKYQKAWKEAQARIAELEKELSWYRTLKIVRHEDNVTEIDGGEKAQMLHEMWEENVRLKTELEQRPGLSMEQTGELFGAMPMNAAQQGAELLKRGKALEQAEAENTKLREALEKYGRHSDNCFYGFRQGEPCYCGFEAALKPASAEGGEG